MANSPGYSPHLRYHHPDRGDNPQPDPFAQADIALAKAVSAVAEFHYPGHPWKVVVSHFDGIVKIQIPVFMGVKNWYVIHIAHIKGDPQLRSVVRGCGEILERYRIPRHRFSPSDFMAARQSIPLQKLGSPHGHVPV